jgi:hypothetical protein
MTGDCVTKEELENTISLELRRSAKDNGVKVGLNKPSTMLMDIYDALYDKFGPKVKVVVLIDEYDSPIQSVITDPKRAEDNRSVLHFFYNKLKTFSD